MSEAAKGRVFSDEHRARLSAARRQYVAQNGGRRMTPEAKEKIGAANRGRAFSVEHKARIGAASRARAPKSPELVRKIRALAAGGVNMSEIARTLEVSRTSVRAIVAGRVYAYIE